MSTVRGRRPLRGLSLATLPFLAPLGGCSSGPEALRFAAMGDMGTGGPGQREVAAALAERAREEPLDFWLALGDNIYPWGVSSADDPVWDEKFESIYDDPALQVPVYATLGNHDYLGLPLAEVDRSKRSATWTMPDRYYAFSRTLADGTTVDFFALDTEMILSGLQGNPRDTSLGERMDMVRRVGERVKADLSDALVRYIAERIQVEDGWAVARIAMLADRTDRTITEEVVDEALAGSGQPDYPTQLAWLEQKLRESSARWKIVFGHHPLYSHNPWREVSPVMRGRLEPILVEGGVDLYLAGHDHFLDGLEQVEGIHHVTSGGGSGGDVPYEFVESDDSYYEATGGGFTLVRVTAEELVIEFVDLQGITRHTQVLSK